MKHWRAIIVVFIVLLPFLALMGVGVWMLWRQGWLFWSWWALPVSWALAAVLANRWRRKLGPNYEAPLKIPSHWTPQDQQAAELVRKKQRSMPDLTPKQLTDPRVYLETSMDLAMEIARHYHPNAKDPLSSLTVPEIMAAAELALTDLDKWVHDYVPGSRRLTVKHWRLLSQAPRWLKTAGDVTWAVSIFMNPANVARYLSSKFTIGPVSKQVQAHLLEAFYVAFVQRVGFYLIEMNSGRLRHGATRYRAMMRRLEPVGPESAKIYETAPTPPPQRADGKPETSTPPSEREGRPEVQQETNADSRSERPPEQDAGDTAEVTITLVGRHDAGKSSLIDALLGKHRDEAEISESMRHVSRYHLEIADTSESLNLLDTPDYGEEQVSRTQNRAIQAALRGADLILLVRDARDAQQQTDAQRLRQWEEWLHSQTQLKPPAVLCVLTHIDLLEPDLPWSPPYDWRDPKQAQERSIRAAVDAHRETLGPLVDAVVPVCCDVQHGKIYGVYEWLIPEMTSRLGEARACAMVRNLHAEVSGGLMREVFRQVGNVGSALWEAYTDRRKKHGRR